MIHQKDPMGVVGMVSLTVDIKGTAAEYGRLFIDQDYRGKAYAEEAEHMIISYAFDILGLDYIWGTVLSANEAILALHQKTGFQIKGEDFPGQTHYRGPVTTVYMSAETWRERREAVAAKFGLTLPGRQPKPC
jgi:RimJ/RimL family protein N-acetyltransferase